MDVCKFDPLSIELKERLLPLEICICIFEKDSAKHGNRAIRDSLYSFRKE